MDVVGQKMLPTPKISTSQTLDSVNATLNHKKKDLWRCSKVKSVDMEIILDYPGAITYILIRGRQRYGLHPNTKKQRLEQCGYRSRNASSPWQLEMQGTNSRLESPQGAQPIDTLISVQ